MSAAPTCTVNYLCIGALLVFVGSILLCTLGFTVILPYEATRNWTEVTCTVVNSTYNRHLCSCQRSLTNYEPCNSKYPCLQVFVSVSRTQLTSTIETSPLTTVARETRETNVVSPSQSTTVASLTSGTICDDSNLTTASSNQSSITNDTPSSDPVPNEVTTQPQTWQTTSTKPSHSTPTQPSVDAEIITLLLYRSWSDAFYKKCSLQECNDEEWNYKQTAKFHENWGQRASSFPCFQNPADPLQVIAIKTSFPALLQAVLWSASCLGLGAMVWIGLCFGVCSMDSSNTEADEPLMAVKPMSA